MSKQTNDGGKVIYGYNCPIATHDQWPPRGEEGGEWSIWGSLEANPSKMASYHGYSYEAVEEALERWEHHGSGILMSPKECESFRNEVYLWCQVERQTWTFKRTLATIYGLQEGLHDPLGFMNEEEG